MNIGLYRLTELKKEFSIFKKSLRAGLQKEDKSHIVVRLLFYYYILCL
jgi:hypothetical protein